MNYTQQQIQAQCKAHGSALVLPAGINGARLMWAIAGAESSFGANCKPRHENAYDHGGLYDRNEESILLKLYGSQAAASYGPWQVLVCNAAPYTPVELAADLDKAADAARHHIQSFCVNFRKALTVEQIAQTYNSGNFHENPPSGVLRYAQTVRDYYDKGL